MELPAPSWDGVCGIRTSAALAGGALPSSLRGGPQALKLDNNEATPAGLKKVKAQLKRDKCTMCEDCALKRNHPGICRPA